MRIGAASGRVVIASGAWGPSGSRAGICADQLTTNEMDATTATMVSGTVLIGGVGRHLGATRTTKGFISKEPM